MFVFIFCFFTNNECRGKERDEISVDELHGAVLKLGTTLDTFCFKGRMKVLNPYYPAVKKITFAFFCAVLIYKFSSSLYPEMLVEPHILSLSWLKYFSLFFFIIFIQRLQYYYAWVFADAICNLSGFGFRGFDEKNNEKWDLVTNVHPIKVETASSFKNTLDGWNCTTMYWLRRVAYDRVPKNYKTISTYLLSALWHGFFLGYYTTFITGALVTLAARTVRRCVRHHFQSSKFSIIIYNILTFFTTKIALMYTTFPFVTMHLNPGLYLYKKLYFFLHILAIAAIFLLPKMLPLKTEVKSKNN